MKEKKVSDTRLRIKNFVAIVFIIVIFVR